MKSNSTRILQEILITISNIIAIKNVTFKQGENISPRQNSVVLLFYERKATSHKRNLKHRTFSLIIIVINLHRSIFGSKFEFRFRWNICSVICHKVKKYGTRSWPAEADTSLNLKPISKLLNLICKEYVMATPESFKSN